MIERLALLLKLNNQATETTTELIDQNSFKCSKLRQQIKLKCSNVHKSDKINQVQIFGLKVQTGQEPLNLSTQSAFKSPKANNLLHYLHN